MHLETSTHSFHILRFSSLKRTKILFISTILLPCWNYLSPSIHIFKPKKLKMLFLIQEIKLPRAKGNQRHKSALFKRYRNPKERNTNIGISTDKQPASQGQKESHIQKFKHILNSSGRDRSLGVGQSLVQKGGDTWAATGMDSGSSNTLLCLWRKRRAPSLSFHSHKWGDCWQDAV